VVLHNYKVSLFALIVGFTTKEVGCIWMGVLGGGKSVASFDHADQNHPHSYPACKTMF